MTDFRALCAELLAATDEYTGMNPYMRLDNAMKAARAALAQPEPQGPTDEELWDSWLRLRESLDGPAAAARFWECAQAAVRPTITPISVSKRPWEREGWCDANQKCWVWNEGNCRWWEFIDSRMISFSHDDYTHCLPHWALPVPKSEVSNG
ncbi:MAG: hypothetical protein EBT15_06170 [Betaproteobacteria bacterium]|nr:hypothetical protein [Betaproteobacteria bacterium]